ncbi:RecQ family ATP-dependent DNA helicase [Propionivibrio sp.]|uniref:RecQ family ATP-dependent DNA helicase n=1 Tax=Propionivibrio sp. TaxID=2212460 RepID=UPI003BF230F5
MSSFAPRCLSIDLEVGLRDTRIHSFAAVRGDPPGASLHFRHGNLLAALEQLDRLAEGANFLLGHNLIAFDLPHLAAAKPDLRLLQLPAVDTLWLNPLAFPRNPYHHLVKHYQDGQLKRGRLNDPLLDAQLTLEVFGNQQAALAETSPNLVLAWHWLTTVNNTGSGLDRFFMSLRHKARPSDGEALAAIRTQLAGEACQTHANEIVAAAVHHDLAGQGWSLAYALAWLSVAGGNSVMPPWVRHQFPQAGVLIKRLRDTACADPACAWCREHHDAQKELAHWFGFPEFRPEPADEEGRPLQQSIVEAAMRGEHILGILPTGTGKSLCYQIPALSRFDKTGALTVVISPLVALMADQVAGLEARNIKSCAALNGLLSMPERADVLDRVRLGDIGILIISPEQLRNRTLRKVLAQREIGAWVLDEAHCLSKWGQDFRPDYRYVGRFIREKAGEQAIPPVLCLTATAKPDVVVDILAHFKDKVGIELRCFNGGAKRTNLDFCVVQTSQSAKLDHIHQILEADLPPEVTGGAIVYCATRKQTEEVSGFLLLKGWAVGHYHARLPPETKKSTQKTFIEGGLRVIVATNAFGMGIDKPDVRLVIHADIPGSLENYLQEAGRAGRDSQSARCVLLYTEEDVERQFGMSARSRLSRKEIQTILHSLRNLERKKRRSGGKESGKNSDLIATAGEILAEDENGDFERDSATDDTRVRTAVSWLEEAALLTREENRVQIFPSSLRIASLDEAKKKLDTAKIPAEYRNKLLAIVGALIGAPADEGISTDELMLVSGLSSDKVRAAFYDLEALGLASNDTALTAYVHVGVERSSKKRFEQAAALEAALIGLLREQHPDLGRGESSVLHLRHANQHLKDAGHPNALPERLRQLLSSLAADGRDQEGEGGQGSLKLRRVDAESVAIELQREWSALETTARRRRAAAGCLLEHLLASLPQSARGNDQLAETTLGKLLAALESDLALKSEKTITPKLLDRALLWLHEQEIIRLNKGLAVFRPAMTIRLEPDWKKKFTPPDFAPLKLHYDEQVVQIHVMAEYVQRGLKAMAEALHLTMDYFSLQRDEFMQRWLPDRDKELARQTTPQSWHDIVEVLNNKAQREIVADDRESTNVLVLAGPGSGKTRVLVHRIAYLIRARRENPHGILALAYNRHAAVQIRQRLAELIGDDARGVSVLTLHALAMRLVGASLEARNTSADTDLFRQIIEQAVALLKGEDLPPEEADQQRDRLLAGFRWILVDEYQDIAPEQYELISALAGRTRSDEDGRINLFAVGDDDQNIYAFNGASVEFIRRFEADYAAKPAFLTDNYRSTAHIIEAANRMIAPAANRMKQAQPIRINAARKGQAAGGEWASIDPVGQGRVQILAAGDNDQTQALAVIGEFERMAQLAPDWDWARCAIIARHWRSLDPVRSYCELKGIPVQQADEDSSGFWSLRETQSLVGWLRARDSGLIDVATIRQWLEAQPEGTPDAHWWDYLREAIAEYALEVGDAELPLDHFLDWLAEWGREARRRQTGLLLLTAHKAKGLEFDHVAVLDGDWRQSGANEDADATRRLYYVAMTRARKTLALARFGRGQALLDGLLETTAILRRPAMPLPTPPPELARRYRRLGWKQIDLDFAAQHPPGQAIHQAIAALAVGSRIELRQRSASTWRLCDAQGVDIGSLSQHFAPEQNMDCIEARVAAIHVRRPRDVADQYKSRINPHCESWEMVVPELVFAPRR